MSSSEGCVGGVEPETVTDDFLEDGHVVLWRVREKGASEDEWSAWTDFDFESSHEFYDRTLVEVEEVEFVPLSALRSVEEELRQAREVAHSRLRDRARLVRRAERAEADLDLLIRRFALVSARSGVRAQALQLAEECITENVANGEGVDSQPAVLDAIFDALKYEIADEPDDARPGAKSPIQSAPVSPVQGGHEQDGERAWGVFGNDNVLRRIVADGNLDLGGLSDDEYARVVSGRCFVCGGKGRRSSWVNELGREVEGECRDCNGTGVSGRVLLSALRLVEEELRQAREERDRASTLSTGWAAESGRWEARYNEAVADRDRLAEALREIADQDWVENVLDPQWAARIAEAALSPVFQGASEVGRSESATPLHMGKDSPEGREQCREHVRGGGNHENAEAGSSPRLHPSTASPDLTDPPVQGEHEQDGEGGVSPSLDEVYAERNKVVLAFAALVKEQGWDVGLTVDPSSPDWPVLMIETDAGQVSWHFQAGELPPGLPLFAGKWDGHSTPEKYARLAELVRSAFGLSREIAQDGDTEETT